MLDTHDVSHLAFPSVRYGAAETPLDLKPLLYFGGAKTNQRIVRALIANGQLGNPIVERFELLNKVHEVLNAHLLSGGSVLTLRNSILRLRYLLTWAEENRHPIRLETIQTTYLKWTDSLVHRSQVIKDLAQNSAYMHGADLGLVLDKTLCRITPMIQLTRLRMPTRHKGIRGIQADKQNLQETFSFGHLLQDICDGLSVDIVLKAPLPVRIPMRNGGELLQWSRLHAVGSTAGWEAEGTLRTRHPLANLRLEAELLMFIGQTGINLAQAQSLRLCHFFYVSHLDGFQVKDRKNRKGGEVLFEIFKDYKPHFERYLAWRQILFPDTELLFPFLRPGGKAEHTRQLIGRLRGICKSLGIKMVSPQRLRTTRVNWLLRRSGDPDLTAAMAQHTKETLLRVYERPSLQRAMTEVTRFWSKHDLTLIQTISVAPGQCNGQPAAMPSMPSNVATPDCVRPSGCLWCEHHRDIDSQDYVWSLISFRHLKTIEVSKWHRPHASREIHPAEPAINRITDKLRWFHDSNARRRDWVEEAQARVDESNYHPDWLRVIARAEEAL